jgi:hypothetical protein
MTSQEYQEAIDWLFVQMPNYQIDGKKLTSQDSITSESFATFSEIRRTKSKRFTSAELMEKVLQAICWLRFYKNQATKPDFIIRPI